MVFTVGSVSDEMAFFFSIMVSFLQPKTSVHILLFEERDYGDEYRKEDMVFRVCIIFQCCLEDVDCLIHVCSLLGIS